MPRKEADRREEIELMREIEVLKQKLGGTLIEGAQIGDLAEGNRLRQEIETKLKDVREALLWSYPVCKVKVDYDWSVVEAIKKSGFKKVNEQIFDLDKLTTETGQRNLNIYLFTPRSWKKAYIEGLITSMKNKNLRPANLKELIALGTQYPELADGPSIAALGTKKPGWGYVGVPYLDHIRDERDLDLYTANWFREGYWYFAAVRK